VRPVRGSAAGPKRRARDSPGGPGCARRRQREPQTHAREARAHRLHINIWIAVGAVLLALVAAVGAGVLIGRSTESAAPTQGLASEQVVAMIDGTLDALNRGDWGAFAAYWTRDAVMEDAAIPAVARGRQEIVDLNEGFHNLGARYYRVGPVIQHGDLAAYAVSCPPCPGGWSGIDLVEFDENFKTTHLWTGNTAEPEPGS
jgi:hypothetical protein